MPGLGEGRGRRRAGCGDIYGARGEAAAVAAVLGAADSALAEAGAGRRDVAAAAFRLAGRRLADRQFWDEVLSTEWPGPTRSILNDGYAAIRCGELSGVGVAVNAGTNAAIAARGPDGTTWDMSWWGQHAMGAFGLVTEALKAVFLAEIDAAPATALGPALLDFYGLPDLTELNRWFTRRRDPADPGAERPRAARVVTEAARQGDPVAIDIVREQGRRLAFYAEVAARHAGLVDTGALIPVVLSGSIFDGARFCGRGRAERAPRAAAAGRRPAARRAAPGGRRRARRPRRGRRGRGRPLRQSRGHNSAPLVLPYLAGGRGPNFSPRLFPLLAGHDGRLVGPVLRMSDDVDAIVAAIVDDNPGQEVTVVDRGAYTRVSGDGELRVTRVSIARHLGRDFSMRQLEGLMSAFAGRIAITSEEVRWRLKAENHPPSTQATPG